jgi:hypothetical protein
MDTARKVQAKARYSWRMLAKVVVTKRIFEAIRRKYQKRRPRRKVKSFSISPTTHGSVW